MTENFQYEKERQRETVLEFVEDAKETLLLETSAQIIGALKGKYPGMTYVKRTKTTNLHQAVITKAVTIGLGSNLSQAKCVHRWNIGNAMNQAQGAVWEMIVNPGSEKTYLNLTIGNIDVLDVCYAAVEGLKTLGLATTD